MTPDEWMDSDGKPPVPEMTPAELELAARIRETFYAYTNRLDRSQQSHLGPSEVGTPCDRRLALHMLGMRPVNPGGDNWASFKGTCVHAGLADMFTWADASTGRYAVEVPLALPSAIVPRGTADLLDRVLCLLGDQKVMGHWSLDKLRRVGPSPTYIVQVHLYAYAARRRGERVDEVAIVAWPIEDSSLDGLVVWRRPYDPTIAPRALVRVEHIAGRVRELEDRELDSGHASGATGGVAEGLPGVTPGRDDHGQVAVRLPAGRDDHQSATGGRDLAEGVRDNRALLRLASDFEVADDCRYCPYSAPNDMDRTFGCNGKK